MARRRTRINWPLFWIGAALLAAFLGYCIVAPAVEYARGVAEASGRPSFATSGLSLPERIRTRCVEYFIGLWIFSFGAIIGSFLNVVAYRMPRGESVVWRPSRCPFCETPIRSTDNIPVLGWLRLRGRCRACRLPISPRYPTIEFLMGLLFFSFALADLFSGAMLNPALGPLRGGVAEIVLSARWDFAAVLAYQGCLAALLMGVALMRFDGQRPPGKLIVFAFVVAFAAPLAFPELRPEVWSRTDVLEGALHRLEAFPAGILCGLALGYVWHFVLRYRAQGIKPQVGPTLSLMMVGLFFGWQAACSVFGLALVVHLVAGLWACQTHHRNWPADASVLAGFYVHTLGWSVWEMLRWWPSQDMSAAGLLLYVLLCGCLLVAVRSVMLLACWAPADAA